MTQSTATLNVTAGHTSGFWTINRKILFPVLAVILLLATGLAVSGYLSSSRKYAEQEKNNLLQIQSGIFAELDGINQVALALSMEAAQNPEVQAAFAKGDRDRLTELMLPTYELANREFEVKQFVFHSPPATSFLRLQQLDKFGDDLSKIRKMVVVANAEEKIVQGVEVGRNGIGTRGVVPVTYRGRHIGLVDVGIDIGQAFLDKVKETYGVESQFLLDSKAAEAATFQGSVENAAGPTGSGLLLQASTLAEPIYAEASAYPKIIAGETVISYKNLNGRSYVIMGFPIYDYSNTAIGVLEIVVDRTDAIAVQNRETLTTVFASLLAIFISILMIVRSVNTITKPIVALTETAVAVANGNLERQAKVESDDEIGTLTRAFNQMITELRNSLSTLEQRIAERTQNLELAAEVGRSVSQVRALDVMLTDAAELIRKQFNLYYVQVYLTDPSRTKLNLQAGTGEVGLELLNRSHSLPLNSDSINGRAAIEKQSVVISNTAASATFKPNPLLPNTRSEMAVPLLIGEKVVGVLDMQSEIPDALNKEELAAFEALAGQLAIAIQNATFLAETEQARAEVEAQAQRLSRTNWEGYLDAIHAPEKIGFVFEQNKIAPLAQEEKETENALAAPIAVTGEALGRLVVELGEGKPIARSDELINTVARQVAQQIESLRLLESAERFRYEAEQASRRLTHEGWQEYMEEGENAGYIYDLKEVRPYKQDEQAQAGGVSVPLKVRDETIGKLTLKGVDASDSDAVEIINAVAERLGAHIEGLRLSMQTENALASTKKQAQREQALRQITSAVRGSTDPAVILRTAARELGNIMGRQTIVRLTNAAGDKSMTPSVSGDTNGGKQ